MVKSWLINRNLYFTKGWSTLKGHERRNNIRKLKPVAMGTVVTNAVAMGTVITNAVAMGTFVAGAVAMRGNQALLIACR